MPRAVRTVGRSHGAYPGRQPHLVMGDYAAHKTPEIQGWLAANARVEVQLTPTYACGGLAYLVLRCARVR